MKFAEPGGAFLWKPSGGPKLNTTVSFSVPYKAVTFAVDLGYTRTDESLEYVQAVDNCTNYVKLYVTITTKVQPYIVYRTDSAGNTEAYYIGAVKTPFRYALSVKVVG